MEKWFSQSLANWYKQNKRDLPWRKETDPYKIWLSEVILQQTQVVQGLAYYERFIKKYPTVKRLAGASEDEVLKLWQGLGYYSRGRNLLSAAKIITAQHNGIFPDNYIKIRNLKGVGDYTAAAIASFAFNLPYAVVDGNVYRVLSRLFGISTPIDSTAGKKEFSVLANQLLEVKNPAIHNQAIMEFGSQYCKPVKPDCPNCIFRNKCLAFYQNRVAELPKKGKKIKVKKRHFNYLVISDGTGNVLINRRAEGDIWQGLYEFVLFETPKEESQATLLNRPELQSILGKNFEVKGISKAYKHVLTHVVLITRFYIIEAPAVKAGVAKKINLKKLSSYAYPRLIGKFLDDWDLKEIL